MKHKDYYWVIILIGCILIIIAPSILTLPWRDEVLGLNTNFKSTGQIGDTIGGITAPIIGLISIILLYITFREQRHTNRWTLIENIQSKIEKNLSICLHFYIYKEEKDPLHYKTDRVCIAHIYSLLSQFTVYTPKLHPEDGYKLYMALKDCYNEINQLILLTPKSAIYQKSVTQTIKLYTEKIIPIYNAIENNRIQFIPIDEHNIDKDGDLKNLVKYLNADKALFEKLPSEYLPDKHKKE